MLNNLREQIYGACVATGVDVYDYWETEAEFPYIINYSVDAEDINYKDIRATQYTFEIHIFDKNNGKITVLNLIDALRTAFYSLDLSVANKEFSQMVTDDKEPNVVHGIVTIRLLQY